jgi:hypothetical protein
MESKTVPPASTPAPIPSPTIIPPSKNTEKNVSEKSRRMLIPLNLICHSNN